MAQRVGKGIAWGRAALNAGRWSRAWGRAVMALVAQRVGKGISLDDIDARGLWGRGHDLVVDILVRLIVVDILVRLI